MWVLCTDFLICGSLGKDSNFKLIVRAVLILQHKLSAKHVFCVRGKNYLEDLTAGEYN